MHSYPTINAIVDHMLNTMSPEDLAFVKSNQHDFGEIGRYVRNTYDLWHSHPLTELWRADPTSRDIRNDIDWSEGHPDTVSAQILIQLRKRLK